MLTNEICLFLRVLVVLSHGFLYVCFLCFSFDQNENVENVVGGGERRGVLIVWVLMTRVVFYSVILNN